MSDDLGFDEMTLVYKREIIRDVLDQCTEPQKDLFNRAYVGGVDNLRDDQMRSAYYLCKRTIDKNYEAIQHETRRKYEAIKAERREKAKELEKTMQCNCDLDNWEPEDSTGHSFVCRIHKAALAQPKAGS